MKETLERFFERMYESELNQKQKLDSGDTFLVGIIGALTGVAAYYLKTLVASECGIVLVIFSLIGGLYLAAVVTAIIFVIASIWPRDKGYIASPREWAKYVDGLEKYHTHYHDQQVADEKVADDVADWRRQQYIEAGEINRELVVLKHGYQTKAKRALISAVILMLFNALPLCFLERNKHESEQRTAEEASATPPKKTRAAEDSSSS